MPRGGGRKVTQICSRMYAFSSLTRLLLVAAVPHDEKKSNPSFFFLFFRARVYIVYLFFLRDDHPSLFLCAAEHSRGRSGFPKRARFVRERERETHGWCGFRSPLEGKKEREKTNAWSHPLRKEVHEKRGKKKRIDSQNITYRRKKEKEREREKESVF